MRRHAIALVALAVALLVPAASRADDSSFRILVNDADGSRVDIQIPSGWVTGLLASATLDCDTHVDRDTARMARTLARQGEGSVTTYTDDEGREVVARRSRGQLKMEIHEKDGDRSTVEIPWSLAQCLLLGQEPEEGLGRALARDGVHIKVRGHDSDGSVQIVLDGDD